MGRRTSHTKVINGEIMDICQLEFMHQWRFKNEYKGTLATPDILAREYECEVSEGA